MRKVSAAALTLPVIARHLATVLRRSGASRVAFGLGVASIGALVALVWLGVSRPDETVATPPSRPVPLTNAAFTTDLRSGQDPDSAVEIVFSTAMNAGSVQAHLSVEPAVPVALDWDESGTTLTVAPAGAWNTARFHTITVEAGALAQSGRPLTSPVRAAFLTRPATDASITPTGAVGEVVLPDTAFVIQFDRSIDPATLRDALRITPVVDGTLERLGRRTGDGWRFTPARPLALDTTYRLSLAPAVRDSDGARLADTAALTVRTAAAPRVVRFRPASRSTGVGWNENVSVRFSEPMDVESTAAAFRVTAAGEAVDGKVSFAEDGSVLIFDPTGPFGYGQRVELLVEGEARSALGIPMDAATSVAFTTAPRPAPRIATSVPIPTGGGPIGSSAWAAVESYYLNLMNCTRTGGWVTSSGECSSPGGRNVAPLILDGGLTANVARPYARLLAEGNLCSHFIGGNPGDRLRAAGYTGYNWAENIGCRGGDPYAAVLATHLFYQSEQPYNGGHYVNLMNATFTRVGIGVWVAGGRVRLVIDFIG